MSAAASAFDEPSLYVPGLSLLLLGVGSWLWVGMAAPGAAIPRIKGPPPVEEGIPDPARLTLRKGMAPPPGGELDEPLLGRAVPLTADMPTRIKIDVRF